MIEVNEIGGAMSKLIAGSMWRRTRLASVIILLLVTLAWFRSMEQVDRISYAMPDVPPQDLGSTPFYRVTEIALSNGGVELGQGCFLESEPVATIGFASDPQIKFWGCAPPAPQLHFDFVGVR